MEDLLLLESTETIEIQPLVAKNNQRAPNQI